MSFFNSMKNTYGPQATNYMNNLKDTYGPQATNYLNNIKNTYGSQATNYMNNLKDQYTPLINNAMNQGFSNQNQGLMNQGAMNQGLMNQGAMNQGAMNQGLMNQGAMNQGLMNQDLMNQGQMNQGAMNQGQMNQGQMNQGSDRFGIPVSTYKQGFLNAIARWNVASGSSNAFQRMGNNSMSVEQIQATRDQRIRQALNEVLAMPNLGKYQALNAVGDATGNYLQYMANGFSNKTRGGKRRRRGSHKTRRHRK
jgi:hypothetical protein